MFILLVDAARKVCRNDVTTLRRRQLATLSGASIEPAPRYVRRGVWWSTGSWPETLVQTLDGMRRSIPGISAGHRGATSCAAVTRWKTEDERARCGSCTGHFAPASSSTCPRRALAMNRPDEAALVDPCIYGGPTAPCPSRDHVIPGRYDQSMANGFNKPQ